MKDRKTLVKVALVVFITMVAGFFSGWAWGVYFSKKRIHSFIERSPEERKEIFLKKLSRELELTPSQVDRIREVMEESFAKIHEARKRCIPEEEAIKAEGLRKIEDILDDKQKVKWESIKIKLLKKKPFHRPPPPPGIER